MEERRERSCSYEHFAQNFGRELQKSKREFKIDTLIDLRYIGEVLVELDIDGAN